MHFCETSQKCFLGKSTYKNCEQSVTCLSHCVSRISSEQKMKKEGEGRGGRANLSILMKYKVPNLYFGLLGNTGTSRS